MGTRCLTVIEDEQGTEILVMYRQFDGYPEGHGKELKSFLKGFKIVNGISDRNAKKTANGAHCLAGQIVVHFKGTPEHRLGGIYLYPAGTRDVGEEYVYRVRTVGSEVSLTVLADGVESSMP